MTLTALLLGIALLLAIVAGFAFLGVCAQKRLAPDLPSSEGLLDAILFAIAIAIGCVELLGFAGALTPGAVLAVCAVGVAIAWRINGRVALADCAGYLRALRRALRRSPWLWALCAWGILIACHGLARVPLPWDALTYHLTYVSLWIQHHAFVPFDAGGAWEEYQAFPKSGEALFWLAMAPLHGDVLVNLVNLPFWFGIALSFRCAAVRLGASASHADAWCLPLLLHPMLAGYVTPTYVEVQIAFYATAAVACAARSLSDLRALAGFALAVGLACTTKITALAWLAPAGLWLLVLAREHGVRPVLRGLRSPGVVLGAVTALPWYVANAVACDNPLYPAPLPFATSGPAAGSLELARALTSSSIVGIGNFGELFDMLLAPPWSVSYPLGPGALFTWLWLAMPIAIACTTDARSKRRIGALWALSWFLVFVYLLSPHNGFFIEPNSRFLTPPCVLTAIALAVAGSMSRRSAMLHKLLLVGTYIVALLGLWPSQLWRFPKWAPFASHPAVWVVGVLGVALLCGELFASKSRSATWTRRALLLALGVALVATLQQRERNRYDDLATGLDLHPVEVERGLWRHVAELSPGRIAFAIGGYHSAQGWFFYPLFGASLQHEVQYIDIERNAGSMCRRRGLVRDEPDLAAWLDRLAARRTTHLFLLGRPIESEWAHAHPERFTLLAERRDGELYRVNPATRAPLSSRSNPEMDGNP